MLNIFEKWIFMVEFDVYGFEWWLYKKFVNDKSYCIKLWNGYKCLLKDKMKVICVIEVIVIN